jgi:hypothetical protein
MHERTDQKIENEHDTDELNSPPSRDSERVKGISRVALNAITPKTHVVHQFQYCNIENEIEHERRNKYDTSAKREESTSEQLQVIDRDLTYNVIELR